MDLARPPDRPAEGQISQQSVKPSRNDASRPREEGPQVIADLESTHDQHCMGEGAPLIPSNQEGGEAQSLSSRHTVHHAGLPNGLESPVPPITLARQDEAVLPGTSYLKPQQLVEPPRKKRWAFFPQFIVGSALTLGIISLIGFLIIEGSRNREFTSGDCEGADAKGIQASLLINLIAAPSLTFSQAKLVDLVWDTIFGQGGRFLHAWGLYRVVARCLTATMESNSIPMNHYLDLSFSTTSLNSFWAAFSLLFDKRKFQPIYLRLWLIFAIAYVLGFSTLWSAATGYISRSIPTYSVQGTTYVSLRSRELTLCWVFDDERVTINGSDTIIHGPQFSQLISDAHGIHLDNINILDSDLPDEMDEFVDVYAYFVTKNSLKYGGPKGLPGQPKSGAWQYENAKRIPKEQQAQVPDLPENSAIAAHETKFIENTTETSLHSSYNQYNSSIWLKGKLVTLQAPFLDGSLTCSEHYRTRFEDDLYTSNNPFELCLCLNGVPVNEKIDANIPTGCISDMGYGWGFSAYVTASALVLETIWLFTSWLVLKWTRRTSSLVRTERTGEGVVRNILDAAEAISEHLGSQHSAYAEKDLRKRLDSCGPIGFVIEKQAGIDHIGIRDIGKVDSEEGMRKRVKIEQQTLYG